MANTTWSSTLNTGLVSLTGSDLIATSTSGSCIVHSPDFKNSGKFYFELTFNTKNYYYTGAGLAVASVTSTNMFTPGAYATSTGYIIANGVNTYRYIGMITSGSTIGIAVDFDHKLLWFRLGASGNWNGLASANPATGIAGIDFHDTAYLSPYAALTYNNEKITLNAGDSSFVGSVPSGFTAGWPVGSDTYALTTDTAIEVWDESSGNVNSTQVAAEVWTTIDTSAAKVDSTQVAAEIWTSVNEDDTKVRATQASIEIWAKSESVTDANAISTQVAAEIWTSVEYTAPVIKSGAILLVGI